MKNRICISLIIMGFALILMNSCKTDDSINSATSSQNGGLIFNPNLTYGTVTDVDGNIYKTINIGTQTWMAENLRSTHYRNGETIPEITDYSTWTQLDFLTKGAYCNYRNTRSNDTISTFGRLYNWSAVNDLRSLAPIGWHVPSDSEWTVLTTYLGSEAGAKLKEKGNTHWLVLNKEATNESGFTAIPGGYRINNTFYEFGNSGYWWSSTDYNTGDGYILYAWYRGMGCRNNTVDRFWEPKELCYSVRCIKDATPRFPTITTSQVFAVTNTTATSGGQITSEGGSPVISRGVCWSTNPNPTTANNHTSEGTGTGSFTSLITGLLPGATYYLRAYAVNSVAGTVYGNEFSFITYQGTVTDIDGNVYNTIQIGTQVWMAENLKTTKYRNGDLIGTTTPATLDILDQSAPKYQWANGGNDNRVATYGRLYTWYAVNDSRNICPIGWHVPSDAEWTALTTYLGGESIAGGKLKEAGTIHWISPNTGATNNSRFTALPGGSRSWSGVFGGYDGYWWSFTEYSTASAWFRLMYYDASNVFRTYSNKRDGCSVRCIKD